MRVLLILVLSGLFSPSLFAQPSAVTRNPAAATAELAELTSLLRDAAGTEGLPFPERNPSVELSTRLALFPMRFGQLPRETEGYANLQQLAVSLLDRLEKNLPPLADPQPPTRPKLTWWWMKPELTGLPWRFVYGLLLELAGRLDEARSVAFAPDMHTGGCLGRPYTAADLCGFESRLRGEFLVRLGESAAATHHVLAAMLPEFGADDDVLAVEAGWLLEQGGASEDASLLYDWAIQGSGERDVETLGSELARAALVRLGREHKAVWMEHLDLWLGAPYDEKYFRAEQAICMARSGDADSWRLLAIRVPVRPGVADTDEFRVLSRGDDLAQGRTYVEWLSVQTSPWDKWRGLFLLQALDRTGRARLSDELRSLCQAPRIDGHGTLNAVDHWSRAMVGRGPEIGTALPVPNSPGFRNIGLSCDAFVKAWLDELAKPR